MEQTITLANLATKTEQEVFDYVAEHLLTQNQKALQREINGVTGLNVCRYLTEDGLRCAGGCLISSNEYRNDFEGIVWFRLVDRGDIPAIHNNLIYALQGIHDNLPVESWPERLVWLANPRKLNCDIVRKLRPSV